MVDLSTLVPKYPLIHLFTARVFRKQPGAIVMLMHFI